MVTISSSAWMDDVFHIHECVTAAGIATVEVMKIPQFVTSVSFSFQIFNSILLILVYYIEI